MEGKGMYDFPSPSGGADSGPLPIDHVRWRRTVLYVARLLSSRPTTPLLPSSFSIVVYQKSRCLIIVPVPIT